MQESFSHVRASISAGNYYTSLADTAEKMNNYGIFFSKVSGPSIVQYSRENRNVQFYNWIESSSTVISLFYHSSKKTRVIEIRLK